MSQRFAATMILGDGYQVNELEDLFYSLSEAKIDCLYIAYNGTMRVTIEEFAKEWVGRLAIEIDFFEWEDNFGKARQQSFDMVPKDEYDWILWIDSDDKLALDGVTLDEYVAECPDYISGFFVRYDYAIEPDTGIVVVEQWRERLLRASVEWKWKHPIHEVCQGPIGIQFVRKDGIHIEHQRKSGDERGARVRNRRIITNAMEENPKEPRYVFYYAGETMAAADQEPDPAKRRVLADEAISAYIKFKEMIGEATDDYFVAQSRIAECFRLSERFVEAFDADLETIAIYPSWPDGFIGLAKSCLELQDYGRMLVFADIARTRSKPRTAASIESLNSTFTPVFLMAVANEGLGNYEEAIRLLKEAQQFWDPPENKINNKIAELENAEKKEVVQDKNDEILQKKRKKSKNKSIAFITGPLPEAWHPILMAESGSGGAELCIMNVAPMFAADGWRVSVFGTPGPHRGVYDGVEYWETQDLLPSDKYKVLVGSRTTIPFEAGMESEANILWMHDVNLNVGLKETIDLPDAVIGLTPWHVNHLAKLYGIEKARLAVVPNGIDISRFPKEASEISVVEPKFIWSSSYDRGLETLLSLWPVIKSSWPQSTLDIFYGWNMFVKSMEAYKKAGSAQADYLLEFKNKIDGYLRRFGVEGESGIKEHGRVNQTELATYMLDAHLWAYPTQFMETYCITAVEMQAAGVLPIASNLAALTNNVAVKNLLVEGWPQNTTYQRQFMNVLETVMEADSEDIVQGRQMGREFAETQTWEKSYQKWNDLLKSVGVKF